LKRPLSPAPHMAAAIPIPVPQRRRIELDESPTSASILRLIERTRTTQEEHLAQVEQRAQREGLAKQETFERNQAKSKFVKNSKDTAVERGSYSLFKTAPRKTVHNHYDHGTFVPRTLHPLPKDATQASWSIDFAAAKQRYIDKRYGGVLPTVGPKLQTVHHVAHQAMIRGKYGAVVLKPCSCCVDAGEICRVYHSKCYVWMIEGRNMKNHLGWRCYRCRSLGGHVLGPGGCNAQYQA
jgi:hypothetical protein